MTKFIKPGKVVIILAGRHAGKKAIVVKVYDDGSKRRQFGHCLLAGLERGPQKVTKSMSKKKILKRTRVKPFLKYVNYNHIMPTRYQVDIDVRSVVNPKVMDTDKARKDAKNEVRKLFEQRFFERGSKKHAAGVKYFFHKLRF